MCARLAAATSFAAFPVQLVLWVGGSTKIGWRTDVWRFEAL
jgi:hypothetical protein